MVEPVPDSSDGDSDRCGHLRGQACQSVQMIAEWVAEKETTDDNKSQWCHIVAVIDRVMFIGSLTLALSALISV